MENSKDNLPKVEMIQRLAEDVKILANELSHLFAFNVEWMDHRYGEIKCEFGSNKLNDWIWKYRNDGRGHEGLKFTSYVLGEVYIRYKSIEDISKNLALSFNNFMIYYNSIYDGLLKANEAIIEMEEKIKNATATKSNNPNPRNTKEDNSELREDE